MGIIDGWRRFKPEYWGVKRAYSPIRITKLEWTPTGKNITISLENRYDFTSLTDISITAIINAKPQKISSEIPAHSSGNIEIPSAGVKTLRLVFTDPRGFVADEEYFERVRQQEAPVVKTASWKLNETDNAYQLKRGAVSYTISKRTGLIVSGRKNGQEVLTQGPAFCMIPMNNDDGGKPGSVTYQNEIHPIKAYPALVSFAAKMTALQQGGGVTISTDLVYSDSKAKVNYAFEADGKLKVSYELTYTKADISPYQYGLMMQLSKTFDKLTWDRHGEFNTYTADDQSRSAGTAMLNAKETDGVEPWRIRPLNNWKDDANEMGSNDFRSTKRDIKTTSLQDKQGNVVTVTGGAHQASRSWLQDGQINWLIADYFNNGSERFYATPFTNDRIKIAANTTIKGGLTMDIE